MKGNRMKDQNAIVEKDIEVDFDLNPTDLYLHISDSDWHLTLQSLRDDPVQARVWVVRSNGKSKRDESDLRFLPLHSACAREPPLTVVSALLEAYPEGAGKRDNNGMCPLHYATANHASVEVVQMLIEYCPEALFQRVESSGALPIHLAAQWGVSSISVMECLLRNNNSLASARDAEGLSPLEIAIDAQYNENKVGIISVLRDSMLQEVLESTSTLSSNKSFDGREEIQIDCSPSGVYSQAASKKTRGTASKKTRGAASKKTGGMSVENRLLQKRTEILMNEISKLRRGKKYLKSSVEEQLTLEWDAVHIAMKEMDHKIIEQAGINVERAVKNTTNVRDDEVEVNLDPDEIRDENLNLEKEIKKLDKVYKKYRTKVETVESIMKKLAGTMTHMAKNHTLTMERLKRRESEMLRMSKLRAEKLAELAQEVDAVTTKLTTFDFAEEEKKAFDVMKKEEEVLEKMSDIIRALKS